ADILRTDLDIVADYFHERYPELSDEQAEAISEQMDKILTPLYKRLNKIAKDIDVLKYI
ncbi:hypothetical protein LCGC14_1774780, partial [marine sediment metagenome]